MAPMVCNNNHEMLKLSLTQSVSYSRNLLFEQHHYCLPYKGRFWISCRMPFIHVFSPLRTMQIPKCNPSKAVVVVPMYGDGSLPPGHRHQAWQFR